MICLGFSLLLQLLQTPLPQPLAASLPSNLFRLVINVCFPCKTSLCPTFCFTLNCSLWHDSFSLIKSSKDLFQGSVLAFSSAWGELLQNVKGEIPMSPLARLPGLKSVMSTCLLLGEAAFSLLWPAPGGPQNLMGRGVELLSLGCEY